MPNYPSLKLFIDGEWLSAGSRKTLSVFNPATEEVLGQMPVATTVDLEHAISAAARGHQVWSAMSAYARAKILVNAANILHVSLNLSAGERTWGIYHIQNVNNYGSRLKTWMRRFNGVATKYLDSYLGWRRMIDRDGDGLPAERWLTAAVAEVATG